jgi:hypothetical protein
MADLTRAACQVPQETGRQLHPSACAKPCSAGCSRLDYSPALVAMNRYQLVDGLLELLNSKLAGVNW